MPTHAQKCERFAELHRADDIFIIPNPWDIGSARVLAGMGFPALATTSAGFAFTTGAADGDVSLEEKLNHCRTLADATSVPINADFENGFADTPEGVAENVLRVAATGVAGCSIEDFDRDAHVLYDIPQAVERVQAAAEAVASLGMPFQLTARAENFIRGVTDLDDTIKRLNAYEQVGANVLYSPGINTLEQLRETTAAIDKPYNVLAPLFRGATVEEFAAAGAKRISVGSALAWTTVKPLLDGAKEMLEDGSFSWTSGMASTKQVNELIKAAGG